MARILALDWDNQQFHLVAANIGRGKVKIERAISWREEEPFLAANAEKFGQRLQEQMANSKIAAAPLIVGLGRDRVVVKEVRYPQVPEDVEAAVVRNQITKDLTDSPDDVLLDFAPMAEASRTGERRALSLVVRKDTIEGVQTVCRVAGLKLLAVTARPFGIAACFKHLAGATPQVPAPPAPDAVAGVLTVTGVWAEFCAVRGRQLLFARSVAVGDGLLGEVRRNLAAYSGQPQLTFPRDAIQVLYVTGNGENAVLREKLQETLGIPVHGMDPFASEERVDVESASRAGFTGAVGLLDLWATDEATPVNFVKPRESKKVVSPHRNRVLAYAVLGVLAVGFLVYGAYWIVNQNHDMIAELRLVKANLEKDLKDLDPDIKYMQALKEWRDGAVPWIDELYDLAARAPYEKGFRIKGISVTSIPPKNVKERFTNKITIFGEADKDLTKPDPVERLMKEINKDRAHAKSTITVYNVKEGTVGKVEWQLKVEITYQPPDAYKTRLVLPPNLVVAAPAAFEPEPDEVDEK